jgi:hypothetical protein
MLNTILASGGSISGIENESFPRPEKDDVRPLPEDFAVRGLLWTEGYFPDGWFANDKIDEEKYHELPLMTAERKERIFCGLVPELPTVDMVWTLIESASLSKEITLQLPRQPLAGELRARSMATTSGHLATQAPLKILS